jgi:hypothetical protein
MFIHKKTSTTEDMQLFPSPWCLDPGSPDVSVPNSSVRLHHDACVSHLAWSHHRGTVVISHHHQKGVQYKKTFERDCISIASITVSAANLLLCVTYKLNFITCVHA